MPNYTTSYSLKQKKPHYRRRAGDQLPSARRHAQKRPGAQYLHHSQGFGRRNRGFRPQRRDSRRPYVFIAIGCAALLFVASIVWYVNRSVTVSLNGSDVSVRIHSSVQQLIDDRGLTYRAGNLLAVDDSVLEKRGGERYSVVLNGTQIEDGDLSDTELTGGEELEIGNGRDVYEEHDVAATEIQPTIEVKGTGAIQYVETWGIPGRSEVWTGKTSGITADRGIVQEVQNCVVRASSVSPEEGSYVALTFDEGPSSYTQQILQILADKGAQATFFVQGDRTDENQAAVRAIVESGNEIGSNSYADEDLTALSADELRQRLTQGFESIQRASNASCALLRPPYARFTDESWTLAMDLVSAVVTWNIDSGDYLLPGADTMVGNVVGSVRNGNIVLLTDSDACGEQTVQALPEIIDQLKADGYQLVTLSDLVATDKELSESLDLSKVSMPADAVLPQLPSEDTAASESAS